VTRCTGGWLVIGWSSGAHWSGAGAIPRAERPNRGARQPRKPDEGASMNLTISGHHLDVTPALREYVLTKLERVTRHFDQVVDVNVLLSVEKLKEKERRQRAEVTLHVKGKDIFVEQTHEDLYAAIDQLMDKLDRQVCRHKDRVQDHHHVAGKRIAASAI
jgi:putative sigma-54 modulation protein